MSTTAIPASPPALAAELGRWLALASVQDRISASLIAEIANASADMGTETGKLTHLFQTLATKAEEQGKRVANLSAVANVVTVDGQDITIAEVAGLFEHLFSAIVSKILLLSRNAMAMVYAFDEVKRSMTELEHCIQAVDKINAQTRMLAINARIEATRAGASGRAFTVISDEVRSLSGTTHQLSDTMRTHISRVLRGLNESYDALHGVATIDMSENALAKEKIDSMMGALIERTEKVTCITENATQDAQVISQDISAAITSLQFQDRVSQRLEQVNDTLRVVADAIDHLRQDTTRPEIQDDQEIARQAAWLNQLASRYRLSEMRAAFVSRVIDGRDDPQGQSTADAPETGSIELF